MPVTNDRGETLGAWLLAQKGRENALDGLAAAAKADPEFPRQGSPEDVSERLNEMQADGDMHAAIDDTEMNWLGS